MKVVCLSGSCHPSSDRRNQDNSRKPDDSRPQRPDLRGVVWRQGDSAGGRNRGRPSHRLHQTRCAPEYKTYLWESLLEAFTLWNPEFIVFQSKASAEWLTSEWHTQTAGGFASLGRASLGPPGTGLHGGKATVSVEPLESYIIVLMFLYHMIIRRSFLTFKNYGGRWRFVPHLQITNWLFVRIIGRLTDGKNVNVFNNYSWKWKPHFLFLPFSI